jgi:2-iminobutanoate/2-iminopropanoate deaminase
MNPGIRFKTTKDFMRKLRQIVAACALVASGLVPAQGQDPIATKKFITRDGARPNALFAPGIMVNKTLYIAGKGDYRPNASYEEKVRNCLEEVRKTLQQAGLGMEHIVKSFVYLEEPEKYLEFNRVYAEFFPNNPPARTTLGVPHVPGDSRIEITCIAYSDLTERKSIGTPPPGFPFSPGVLAGNTLYLSGKGDHLPDGKHPPTFEEQVRQTMRNVEKTLKDAGLDFRHVVMSQVYLNKYENLAMANKVYSEFFEFGNEPARKTVFVDWIPGNSDVEVTCIATTDLSTRKVVRPASMKYGPNETAMTASPAVWAGPTLYLSGMNGYDSLKGAATQDLAGQVNQMARNHTDILEAAGLTMEDIVAGWVYLRDMEDYTPMNTIYRQHYSRGPGVRTCLMPNAGFEKNAVRVMGAFIAARTRP